VGDDTQVVKKLYQQYVVYQQARELDIPVRPIRQRFSLLEVALGQRPIKKFLGVPHRLPTGPLEYVVPPDHEDELTELLTWVFGNGTDPVIADSREIPALARVIGSNDALEILRRTHDLDAASEMLGGEEEFLLRRLGTAERALRDAAGLVPLYRDEPRVGELGERLYSLVTGIRRQLTR
jgi:hypothetical protein